MHSRQWPILILMILLSALFFDFNINTHRFMPLYQIFTDPYINTTIAVASLIILGFVGVASGSPFPALEGVVFAIITKWGIPNLSTFLDIHPLIPLIIFLIWMGAIFLALILNTVRCWEFKYDKNAIVNLLEYFINTDNKKQIFYSPLMLTLIVFCFLGLLLDLNVSLSLTKLLAINQLFLYHSINMILAAGVMITLVGFSLPLGVVAPAFEIVFFAFLMSIIPTSVISSHIFHMNDVIILIMAITWLSTILMSLAICMINHHYRYTNFSFINIWNYLTFNE